MKASPQIPAIRRSASAFTLIELLVVVTIIAILAALTLQTSGYIQEKAASSRATTEIAALEAALESYKIDNGTYPEQLSAPAKDVKNTTKILIEALTLDPINNNTKIYMEIPPNMLSVQNKTADYVQNLQDSTLVDPFGNSYYYQFPGDPNRNGPVFFDLFSRGKKGDDNQQKWITNW